MRILQPIGVPLAGDQVPELADAIAATRLTGQPSFDYIDKYVEQIKMFVRNREKFRL